MRYHWIVDRTEQGQFSIQLKPGTENIADYHTKHHPPTYHRYMRPIILHNMERIKTNPNMPATQIACYLTLQLLRGCAKTPKITSRLSVIREDLNNRRCHHQVQLKFPHFSKSFNGYSKNYCQKLSVICQVFRFSPWIFINCSWTYQWRKYVQLITEMTSVNKLPIFNKAQDPRCQQKVLNFWFSRCKSKVNVNSKKFKLPIWLD